MRIGNLLVVCVGNICRSPMAEVLLRHELQGKTSTSVASAGLGALAGHAASEHAVALMAERGLDLSGHRARQLTPELVHGSDLVLVMERRHKKALDSMEPAARGKVYRLCEWRDEDVPDPWGHQREAYESALLQIEQGVADWVERIVASAANTANIQ